MPHTCTASSHGTFPGYYRCGFRTHLSDLSLDFSSWWNNFSSWTWDHLIWLARRHSAEVLPGQDIKQLGFSWWMEDERRRLECLSVATHPVVLALTLGETITRQVVHLIRVWAAESWELVIRGAAADATYWTCWGGREKKKRFLKFKKK